MIAGADLVGVVGCGIMGAGIAEVFARAGIDVVVIDVSDDALAAGRNRIERSLSAAVDRAKLAERERTEALANITYSTNFAELEGRGLVVEAVSESEAVKIETFKRIDASVNNERVIVASNTSSIPIMKLAIATRFPTRVIGLHFFNPVPVLDLVEIVPSLLTDEAVFDEIRNFVQDRLGKHVIRSQDRAGFVVNAMLIPYLLSAIRMLESGFASADDIDEGMVRGCAHPMGPLALADLIGLDTAIAIAESMFREIQRAVVRTAAAPFANG